MRKILALILTLCMLMSCGIVNAAFTQLEENENVVRIGVFADSHVLDDSKAINDAIAAFEALDANLDGILMGGDIVANAPTELLSELYDAAVADTKLSAWLDEKPDVATETRIINEAEYSVGTNSGEGKLIWIMGNHEFNTNNSDVAQPEAWKLFQEKTGLGIRGNVKMGGYHFIYSAAQGYVGSYTEEDQTWMLNELKATLADESYAGKPVFLALHHPIPESYHDTTNGANGSNFIAGRYTDEFINYVKSQPRIIEFSAHTHYPIQDPRMIRQPETGGFTAVEIPFAGNGSFTLDRSADIRTASQEDSYGQALMLEINKETNVVTIKRLNLATGEYIGNDWVIDVAALVNGSGYNYTDARYESGAAPVFSSGSVTASNVTANTATITFPAATKFSADAETSYAHIYEVKVVKKETNVVEFSKSMVSDYYKLVQDDTFSMDVDNLDANTEYVINVTAVSPYGKEATVSGEFSTNNEESSAVTIEDEKNVVAGVDEVEEDGLALAGSSTDASRWQAWLGENYYYIHWNFTPAYTGMYQVSSVTSFGTSTPSKPLHVAMKVDDVQVGENIVPEQKGNWELEEMTFGSVLLEKGKTYKITNVIYGGNVLAYLHSSKISYVGLPSDEVLSEMLVTEFRANDTSAMTANNCSSINSNRFHWWKGSGEAYIEWSISPSVTGMYEISSFYGFATGASYSEENPVTIQAKIDGSRVGDVCNGLVNDGSNNKANNSIFGEVLLEEGKTYTLRIDLGGQEYNLYLDSVIVQYKRAADANEFWKDSVTVNGWEPAEKYVAGTTENYGVIISQSNHYATYNVSPGEGFFNLSITYGAGSSLDADAPITLTVNGKNLGTIIAPDNDSYWPSASNEACTLELGVIKLKEGNNTVTLGHTGESGAAYYSVGKVMLNAIEAPVASIYEGNYVEEDAAVSEVVNGTMTAYARLPRSLNEKSLFVAFAIYETNESGIKKLVEVDCKRFTGSAAGEATLTVDDVVKKDAKTYSYKLFYIESEESFKPLF